MRDVGAPCALRVCFTQTNSFVSGETKALAITISLIYSTNIQTAHSGQAFNKHKRDCLKALKPNTISVVFK